MQRVWPEVQQALGDLFADRIRPLLAEPQKELGQWVMKLGASRVMQRASNVAA